MQKLKKVKADGIMTDANNLVRYFILNDDSRIEIPIAEAVFVFSRERFLTIKENMNKEMGKI